ncbi:hypothetical protein GIB67_016019 [Kingdonia uniflora]|uniref:F-box domain-containing protein n=1 Tax=Kingdonia uniflora TaxID=39325 RepID=A0A7J7L1S7_9MAGN|nr:hypothetical protein GIB67_016019 [Kingdonia uniflora]
MEEALIHKRKPTSIPSQSSTSSSSNAISATLEMDCRLWSKLPQTLIDRVIVFLPPPAFVRARSVCKRWCGLLFTSDFLEMYLRISPRHHWFLFFKVDQSFSKSYIYKNNGGIDNNSKDSCEGYLYDPKERTWYRLPFETIPSGFFPASSSGGLVCWVSHNLGPKSLILSNPMIKAFVRLPLTLQPRLFPSVGLVSNDLSLKVVVAGDDLISEFSVKNLSSESFHVDNVGFYSMWGTKCELPRLCSLESGRMVYFNGRFYCMDYNPFNVLVYDTVANSWSKIDAPMKRFLRSPSLVECRGRLMLVAAVEKSKLNVPKSLRFWRLEVPRSSWMEVERMPQQLYLQFVEAEGGKGFDCAGHGDFIVVTIHGSDQILVNDFYKKVWEWIPQCPFISGSSIGGGLCCFAYEPRAVTPGMVLLEQSTFSLLT